MYQAICPWAFEKRSMKYNSNRGYVSEKNLFILSIEYSY
jgi:hypothetical protein